jgi:hypothetical protein
MPGTAGTAAAAAGHQRQAPGPGSVADGASSGVPSMPVGVLRVPRAHVHVEVCHTV